MHSSVPRWAPTLQAWSSPPPPWAAWSSRHTSSCTGPPRPSITYRGETSMSRNSAPPYTSSGAMLSLLAAARTAAPCSSVRRGGGGAIAATAAARPPVLPRLARPPVLPSLAPLAPPAPLREPPSSSIVLRTGAPSGQPALPEHATHPPPTALSPGYPENPLSQPFATSTGEASLGDGAACAPLALVRCHTVGSGPPKSTPSRHRKLGFQVCTEVAEPVTARAAEGALNRGISARAVRHAGSPMYK